MHVCVCVVAVKPHATPGKMKKRVCVCLDALESLTLGEIESQRLREAACVCVCACVRACVFVSIVKDKLSCHFHNPQVSVSSFNLTFLRLETFIAAAINSLSHFFDKSFFCFFPFF